MLREIVLAVQSQTFKSVPLLQEELGMEIFNKSCTLSNAFSVQGERDLCDTLMKLMGSYEGLKNLCVIENDAVTAVKQDVVPSFISDADYALVFNQNVDYQQVVRGETKLHDLFGRPLAPMLAVTIILDAILNDVTTPVPLPKDAATVELLTVVMKAARFNKLCGRTFRVDNSIQGPFASTSSLNMFTELLKEISEFNDKATNLQVQPQMVNYPMEGIILCYIRLVHTSCKLMIEGQKDSLFKSLRYLASRRIDRTQPSRGSSRGGKRTRPMY